MGTIIGLNEAKQIREEARTADKLVVFTNGCFDLLHRGHVEYLTKARLMGDLLIVGLNSDRSVRELKGHRRPFVNELDRATIVAALSCVDYVVIFDEPTPTNLILALTPNVLAKGGDWPVDRIVGREIVESVGGQVVSIESSTPNYSSSSLAEKIRYDLTYSIPNLDPPLNDKKVFVLDYLRESTLVTNKIAQNMSDLIVKAAAMIVKSLKKGGKILLCGNGGSAVQAQHIAAELVGRFKIERNGLPAISLTTDSSIITSISNDYSFREVFSRQLKALATKHDVLIAISTSGNSENVVRAAETAIELEIPSIGMLGRGGGRLAPLVDIPLIVPSNDTARIQEAHTAIGHILCSLIENEGRELVIQNKTCRLK